MENIKKKYGLLGYPLKHSLSPKMHNAAFKKLGISGQYFLFEKRDSELSDFLKSLRSGEISGLNVTVPYKEKILKYLDWISPEATSIGAINTIVNQDGLLKGFNTDWPGFLREANNFINQKTKVALLGAGGAARAVSYALIKEKVEELVIFDIDLGKASNLVQSARSWAAKNSCRIRLEQAAVIKNLCLAGKDLLINATPVGLKAKDPLIIAKEKLHKNLIVFDLIYNPPLTRLLATAKEKGLRFVNGLNMLIYQGAQSFLYFTGANYKLEEIANIMKKALEDN